MKLSLLELCVPAQDDWWAGHVHLFKQIYNRPGANTQAGIAFAKMATDKPELLEKCDELREQIATVSKVVLHDEDHLRSLLQPVLRPYISVAREVKLYQDNVKLGIKRTHLEQQEAEQQRVINAKAMVRDDIERVIDVLGAVVHGVGPGSTGVKQMQSMIDRLQNALSTLETI